MVLVKGQGMDKMEQQIPILDRTGLEENELPFVRLPNGNVLRTSVFKSVVALTMKTGCEIPCHCPECKTHGIERTWDYFCFSNTTRKLEGLCGNCGGSFEYAIEF